MKVIDFRSDTVTQPTEEMRKAIYEAEVGDDVYGDDPTVNKLEKYAAEILGKEAAIFVSSGTMGNQLAIMSQTKRGDEIIVGADSHIFFHEVGAVAVLSGVNLLTIPFKDSIPEPEKIEMAIRGEDIHYPDTGLICLENALGNGKVVSTEIMKKVYEIGKAHHIPVHLDGARLFNAGISLDVDIKEITQYADTISCCLSKGLCAPMGTILAGPEAVIKKARKNRKLLGGGTRQAGMMAAAGIIALKKMTKRLKEDHENARYLGAKLKELDFVTIDTSAIEINMVFYNINKSWDEVEALPEKLLEKGIKIGGYESGSMRLVTNNDISKEDIDYFIEEIKKAFI